MITEEKVKEIKKQLKNGKPAGEVKAEMIRDGYSQEDINKCFVVHTYDMRSWYLFFGIVFLLAGIWAILNNRSLLLLIFSGVLFYLYYAATIKKQGK